LETTVANLRLLAESESVVCAAAGDAKQLAKNHAANSRRQAMFTRVEGTTYLAGIWALFKS
jgi:hypothetical protein